MLVKMKKVLMDLATAHFTKNMLRERNTQILIFFLKNLCFCMKANFHNKSGNSVGHFV